MQRSIKVTIDALGRPRVEAENFQGQSCVGATKPIEDALAGGGGFQREYKPEWEQSQGEAVSEEVYW